MNQERQSNKYKTLPYIPYNILLKLMNNENIFKILKYPNYDCLSKPNLTQQEKVAMLWKNQDNENNYNIFFTPLIEDMILDNKTILKIYRYDDTPTNTIKGIVCYSFDILYGGKTALIDYEGVPCNRGDVMEKEILETLNMEYVNGLISPLQYNRIMSRNCKSVSGMNGNYKYTGTSIIMTAEISSLG